MSTHDINGREYAKLSELKVGDKLEIEYGFICMDKGEIKEVKENKDKELIVECRNPGDHWLAGQTNYENTHLIGMYKVS
jgi:hypothetical protein